MAYKLISLIFDVVLRLQLYFQSRTGQKSTMDIPTKVNKVSAWDVYVTRQNQGKALLACVAN